MIVTAGLRATAEQIADTNLPLKELLCATCHVHVENGFADALSLLSDDDDNLLDCWACRVTTSR